MVYRNNFVVVIKVAGKVLRENKKGAVQIPFGSEYEITLQNKDSRRAVVSVEIDGSDVLKGHQLVIDANSQSTLEGFLDWDGDVTNKFKFIEKTAEVSEFRGDRSDDGIVRVEYRFETARPRRFPPVWYTMNSNERSIGGNEVYTKSLGSPSLGEPRAMMNFTSNVASSPVLGDVQCCASSGEPSATKSLSRGFNMAPEVNVVEIDKSDSGITAHGGKSDQSFDSTKVGFLESDSTVICLSLVGGDIQTGRRVRKPITVKTKIQCPMCGRKYKPTMDFCGKCGSALKKFA